MAVVLKSPQPNATAVNNSITTGAVARSESASTALDQLSSADIAVQVARVAQLPQMSAVQNRADTVNAALTVAPADDTVVAKPQVVATAIKTKKDIISYTTVAGDTIGGIAAKFGVTSNSVRWSNGFTGENIAAGKQLYISPIQNGIVYQVKAGDTPDTLAVKFRANKEQIILFNDAEVGGLKVGERIVIPDGDGSPAPAVRGNFSANTTTFPWGNGAVWGGGGYDRGYCTWWAAYRRMQVGHPVPSNLGNARTWKSLAAAAGIPVGNAPKQYAVIWTPPRDYYGHVGFVEKVNEDGSVYVSEMNTAGWNKVSYKTLSAADAARYSYIYY